MSERGHGCRYCESNRDNLLPIEHEANKGVPILFGLTDFSYRVWRCDMCGAYWGQAISWDKQECTDTIDWFCFGKDAGNIKRHIDLKETVRHKRNLWNTDWNIIGWIIFAIMLFVCVVLTEVAKNSYYNNVNKNVIERTEKVLSFKDIVVTTGNTTVIDCRSGYLTNHTIILFLGDNNEDVVQYGQPKNMCWTSNNVTIANP